MYSGSTVCEDAVSSKEIQMRVQAGRRMEGIMRDRKWRAGFREYVKSNEKTEGRQGN